MSSSVLLMFAMLVSNAGLKIDLRIDKLLIKHVTCTASNFQFECNPCWPMCTLYL